MKIGFSFFFLFCLSLSVLAIQKQNQDTAFTISGSFIGFADGTEVKLEDANTNTLLSSAKLVQGKCTLKGKVQEPTLCWLKVTGEAAQYIYVENSKISLTGSKPLHKNLRVSGSTSHIEFSAFQQVFNPHFVNVQSLVNSINTTPQGMIRDSLMTRYNAELDSIAKHLDEFAEMYPASYVTPFFLFATAQYFDDPVSLEKRFLRLDSSIRTSQIGNSLSAYIAYNKVGAVGTDALDFTQPDTAGNPVSLSSFRGKYVLVDFWASWCGPCRMENPNVVSNYQKFRDKNFTVFGVSLDRPGQKEKWLDAIKQDRLTWTHASDLQFWNNAAAQLYHVNGIPFNILVNPEGKIVARNLRGTELTAKLCELLGCN